MFGPEAEFFVFDDVRFKAEPFNCGYKINSIELPSNMDTEYEMGNLGHRPRTKGGYFPVPPIDSAQDLRSEMLSVMADMGVVTEKHHHEVGAAQHELGIKFGPLVKMANSMQIYKYVIHQVAQVYGKTATFMPKPIFGDNGSGMHTHQSIWKDGKPMFAGMKPPWPAPGRPMTLSRTATTRKSPIDEMLETAKSVDAILITLNEKCRKAGDREDAREHQVHLDVLDRLRPHRSRSLQGARHQGRQRSARRHRRDRRNRHAAAARVRRGARREGEQHDPHALLARLAAAAARRSAPR